jgi:acetyl-CoA carboxylase biotin carboxyl carrier protein
VSHFPHDSEVDSGVDKGVLTGPSAATVTQVFALAEPCARLMDVYRLSSFEYAYGSFRLHLKKADLPVLSSGLAPSSVPVDGRGALDVSVGQDASSAGGLSPSSLGGVAVSAVAVNPVNAPMVGTFYVAAKPGDAPFVTQGSVVKEGQTLCIIEAMKILNEIEADKAGKVTQILCENGQAVEYGAPLFVIA